jgi:exosortase E/protease (VPEID-CTERM system)
MTEAGPPVEVAPQLSAVNPSRFRPTAEAFLRELDWWIAGRIALLLLLCAELVSITLPFVFTPELLHGGPLAIPFAVLKASRAASITAIFVAILLSLRQLRTEFSRVRSEVGSDRARKMRWLLSHLGFLLVLAAGTALKDRTSPSRTEMQLCVIVWAVLAFGALATWSFAFLPPRFWLRWYRSSRREFAYGVFTGCAAFILGGQIQVWWPSLQRSTFWMVAMMLRGVGEQLTVVDPANSLIGTSRFQVNIGPICSGIEGMALISILLAVYLYFFRKELRFPQAFVLLPIGILASWLLNAVRIASLIVLGSWMPAAAIQGFHSVAGWILFNLLTCGIIWGSWRFGLFKDDAAPAQATKPTRSDSPVHPLLPLLAMISTAMIVHALFPAANLLYPLEAIVAGTTLWFCRPTLAVDWQSVGVAMILGAMAFVIWIVFVGYGPALALRDVIHSRQGLAGAAWATLWIAGTVVIVPAVEELAFRDYLRRRFVASDFESAPFSRFTWISFLGSSLLFGLFSGEWIAGTAAGMIFALALYRRGLLSDAIVAHVTSNGLRCACALAAGKLLLTR